MRHLLPLLSLVALAGGARADLLWNQPATTYTTFRSEREFDTGADFESADDFDLVGSIERIVVAGYCGSCSGDADVLGVWVRFYAWNAGVPGALQHEVFLPSGFAGFLHDSDYPVDLEITLPVPFAATGKHFLSVQLVSGAFNEWMVWGTSPALVMDSPALQRDNSAGTGWQVQVNGTQPFLGGLGFQLWGEGPPPPPQTTLVWAQYKAFLGALVPSDRSPANDRIAADDFELEGVVQRVRLGTQVCFGCPTPVHQGAWVRFYADDAGAPGALLQETFLASNAAGYLDEGLVLTLTLPTPFTASGHHWLSVQLQTANNSGWRWSTANVGTPALEPLRVRATPASAWTSFAAEPDADLAFELFGYSTTPPPTPGDDPCGAWQEVPTPAAAPRTDFGVLRDMDAGADGTLMAIGDWSNYEIGSVNGGPYVLRSNGSSWTRESLPVLGTIRGPTLLTVEVLAADDIWIAGSQALSDAAGFLGGQLLALHYDGQDWSVVPTPRTDSGYNGVEIYGIEAIASDDVWFVGGWLGLPCDMGLALHWDGSSFTRHETPCVGLFGDGFDLVDVSAVASNDVWAVGGGRDGDPSAISYIVHWNGSVWSHVPGPTPGFGQRLYAVEALAANDVWASGEYQDSLGYQTLMLHWDGSAWSEVPALGGGGALLGFASNDVYAAGGGLHHWDGSAWSWVEDFGALEGQVTGLAFSSLAATGPCQMWVAGRQVLLGEIQPFTARHTGALARAPWGVSTRVPCHTQVPLGMLRMASPPVIGGELQLEVDDPFEAGGVRPGASASLVLFSLAPAQGFPCGTLFPGFGPGTAAGEILVSLQAGMRLPNSGPISWLGPGEPALHVVAIPPDATLVGRAFHAQALLRDAGVPKGIVLSQALDLVLGY